MRPSSPLSSAGYASFRIGLERLLRKAEVAPPRRGFYVLGARPPSGRIRRVQAFVEAHAPEALRLRDLADVAGLSPYHFSRVFRDEVGETPWAFVRRTRVERAKGLLREGRTLAEAAGEAGFCDQSHLTRAFRALDGRTPGAFRGAEASPASPEASAEGREASAEPPREGCEASAEGAEASAETTALGSETPA